MRLRAHSLAVPIIAALIFGLITAALAQGADVGGVSSGNTIQVTVQGIIIQQLDFQNATGVSKVGQQVDVNASGQNPVYSIYARIKDTRGWDRIDWVEFRAWYKNGNSGALFNSTPGANYNLYLNYTNVTGTPSFSLRWPTTGEVTLVGGTDTAVTSDTHDLTMRFRFRNQIHRADATGAGSWTFSAFAKDSNGASRFRQGGDFGIFRFVGMAVVGAPSGAADPGSYAYLLPFHNITFSTNDKFYLEASATDLTNTANASFTISRQYIELNATGSTGGVNLTSWTAFTVADGTIDIYGHYNDNTLPSFSHAEYSSGVSELGSVRIRVNIPLGQEPGTYTGTLTYRLWQQSTPKPP
jgi:hypothetical protein